MRSYRYAAKKMMEVPLWYRMRIFGMAIGASLIFAFVGFGIGWLIWGAK